MDETIKEWVDSLEISEAPAHYPEKPLSDIAEALIKFSEMGNNADWLKLANAALGIWNLYMGDEPYPESMDGMDGIEEDSQADFVLTGICCGVWESAIRATARMLNIDADGLQAKVSDWLYDADLKQHNVDTTSIESLREQCANYGELLRNC